MSRYVSVSVRHRLTVLLLVYIGVHARIGLRMCTQGADAVMSEMVQYNDWLDEECGNMAREVCLLCQCCYFVLSILLCQQALMTRMIVRDCEHLCTLSACCQRRSIPRSLLGMLCTCCVFMLAYANNSPAQYSHVTPVTIQFYSLHAARASIMQREARVSAVVASLERELQLLAVTGVEDRLQVSAV